MEPANPFSDVPDAANPDAANPYASPNSGNNFVTQLAANAIFLPALLLLLRSGFSALYMVATLAMVLSPAGPFRGNEFESTRWMMVASYSMIFVVSVVCAAGAVAMLRMRARWLAWTAAVLSLLPLFGPCLGLTIPIGIWSVIVLRRPEVNASFLS